MRKIIFGLLFILAGAANALGQSTTVSGNVTDTGSQAWAGGTYQFQFAPNPQFPTGPYTWTGGTLNKVISGTLDGSGNYSVSIPSNTAISPQGSKWILQVTPNATSPSFSTPPTTITGGTQTLNATPPAVTTPPTLFARAYADSEITGATLGSQYFNVTTLLVRVCTVVTGLTCTTWANVGSGGGGGGTVTGTGVANQVAFWTATSAIGGNTNLTFDPVSDSLTKTGTITSFDSITAGPGNGNGLQIDGSAGGVTFLFAGETNSTVGIEANAGVTMGALSGGLSLGGPGETFPVIFLGSGSGSASVTANATASSLTSTVPVVFSGCALGGQSDRSVAGTTDTILAADRCNRVVYTSATAVAVTLPQAGTTGFANSFYFTVSSGGAGQVTITPTVSTINGNATLVLNEGDACRIGPNSTGASYAADCAPPQLVAGTGITLTPAVHSLTIASSGGGGANTALSNLAAVAVNTALLPGTTNSIALGSAGDVWTNLFSTALNCGIVGTGCVVSLNGATSGTATLTAPAVAGTATNAVVSSNNLSAPALVSTVATGTAPFSVASTTNVANLNASSLNGATFAAPGAIGGTTPGSGAFTALTASGETTLSGAGAASTPSVLLNGTIFTGGSATTTFPNLYLNYGAAVTTFATTGTAFGINLPSASTANFLDFHVNGAVSVFNVTSGGTLNTAGSLNASSGSVTAGAATGFIFGSNAKIVAAAAGHLDAGTTALGALTQFTFGGSDSASFPAFTLSGTNINTTLGSGAAGGTLTAGNIPAMQSCGTTSSCAATAIATTARIVYGSAPLVSGTPSTVTITGISPAFSSSSSYVCSATDVTAATSNLLSVANVSGSSFTITGPATNTNTINYICVGN